MITDLSESLSRIETGLKRLDRSTLLKALRPGLSPDEVRRLLTAAGLPIEAPVEALYVWRNGTQIASVTLDDIQMFPGFYLLSLEDAIANYRAFFADPRWNPGWLPLFANGGGDFYLVDLKGQPSGLVRHFRIEEIDHPVEFRSLLDMTSTLAAAFERGGFLCRSQRVSRNGRSPFCVPCGRTQSGHPALDRLIEVTPALAGPRIRTGRSGRGRCP